MRKADSFMVIKPDGDMISLKIMKDAVSTQVYCFSFHVLKCLP